MEDKKERYLNVTLKNEQPEEDEQISISIVGIFKNLKRFFALWIAVSIIVSIVTVLCASLMKQDSYKQMTSLVSFTYDGIEKGLDPNGNKFNAADSFKNPQIIEEALTRLNMPLDILEDVRENIIIQGIIPKDAAERLSAYKNIFEDGGSTALTAADLILENTYYSTKYNVKFDYAKTKLEPNEAANLLNQMLECYSEFFLKKYGFNEALGNSVKAIDYNDYDYAEAIDVFDSNLATLKSYVDNLSSTDSTRFRSSETGCTFADISETIDIKRNIDLDMISSYVTLNTVTKDKETLMTYYQYTVERLQRQQKVDEEILATIDQSIKDYEKNTVMVFGAGGTENMNVSATEASEEYDKLVNKKIDTQADLSRTLQQIDLYNKRLERLITTNKVNTPAMKAKVEENLEKLNNDINELVEKINATADEYYKTVVLSRAFNILVPANASFGSITKSAVKDSFMVVLILDAFIFVIYFGAAVVMSCVEEYKRAHGMVSVSKSDEESSDPEKEKEKEKSKK